MNVPPLNILYADNHLLVVDKPAGIATMGSQAGELTVARVAADYLRRKHNKPGNAFVGVVSRLDRLVSGVLVLARTSKAASRLSEQIRQHKVEKYYLAIVEGQCPWESSTPGSWLEIVDWVAKDEVGQRMRTVRESVPGAQLARLRVQWLATVGDKSLVKLELLTGRKHQIRLQLAEQGTPVWGDSKYGAAKKFSPGIALHCQQLTILHPTLKQPLTFTSSPARHWTRIPSEFERLLT